MSLIRPYPLAFLSDRLPILNVNWTPQRNDEYSGSGDGRLWSADLAPPLWRASVSLTNLDNLTADDLAARLRSLEGSREAWLFGSRPVSYPRADPMGLGLAGATVRVAFTASGGRELALKGLPAGYDLSVGDKFCFTYLADPLRVYFGEVSEPVSADASGATPAFAIWPRLPAGTAADMIITLARPYLKVVIVPGTLDCGTSGMSGGVDQTTGMGFTVVQKK